MKRLALLAALLLPLSMVFAQQNVGFKTDKVEPLVINPEVRLRKRRLGSQRGQWPDDEREKRYMELYDSPTAIRNVHLSFKHRWYLQHRPKQPILLP